MSLLASNPSELISAVLCVYPSLQVLGYPLALQLLYSDGLRSLAFQFVHFLFSCVYGSVDFQALYMLELNYETVFVSPKFKYDMLMLVWIFLCLFILFASYISSFAVTNFGKLLTSVSSNIFFCPFFCAFLLGIQLHICKTYLILYHIYWYIPDILVPG